MTELSELSQLVQEKPLCKLKNYFLQSTKSIQKSAQEGNFKTINIPFKKPANRDELDSREAYSD